MSLTDYERRVQAEKDHYKIQLGDSPTGLVQVPDVWQEVEGLMARKIHAATGIRDGIEVVVSALDKRESPRFLSLGAGSCSLEIQWILPRLARPETCTLECIDLNQDLIEQGRGRAEATGASFVGTAMDINQLELEPETYDVILCWASLHHFMELDRIAWQISRGLKPQGVFITMDICSRNGFLLWPQTREVINEFWELLPAPYRRAHTLGPEPVTCEIYPEVDCAASGFECIRSESILPALERHLERRTLVFAHSLMRRFFDTMFGKNFDLRRPFDRSFFTIVRDYDEMALATRQLRPETFFGIYQKGQGEPRPAPTLAEVFGER